MKIEDKIFLDVHDVMNIMGCKRTKAYKEIAKLNKELQQEGAIIKSGKVLTKYFLERTRGKNASLQRQG